MAGKKNGVELAKAYVQIIPSMEGVQPNIEDALNGGGGVGDIGSRAGDTLGKAFGKAFTVAAGFIKDSIETGMGFDSAMSQVAATMGTTVDQVGALRDKAKEMGSATNYSATQAAEGLNILAMSGYDAEKSMEMLEDVLHLAAAGGMEMSESAADISGAMKGFGDASKDSAYYADLMAKGATLANTSVSQLGQALADGSSMGKAYSQSAESMTVSLLRLAEQGETGSAAATALSAAYANLYTPMDQAKKAMQELGVDAYDPTTGKAREFNAVVNELNEAIQRESQGNEAIANQYKDLIFGKQGLNAYNKLVVTSTEKQEEWAAVLAESTGAASQQYDTMTDNLAGDLDMMKSAFEGLQIEISEELTADLRDIVQAATEGLTWLTEHTHTLIGIIEGIGVAFAAMKLPAAIGAVTTAMRTLNAVCAQNPIAAAFTIAISAGLALKGVIDDCTDAINEIPDAYEGLDDKEVDLVKSIAEGTDDLATAEQHLTDVEKELRDAKNERFVTESKLQLAISEYNRIMESGVQSSKDFDRAAELLNEVIPPLRDSLKEQDAAVGELSAAYLTAKDNAGSLAEAQEQLVEETEAATIAEQEQAAAEEDLTAKKELFAETVKQSMKDALTANIELNDKTIELNRTTAEQIGDIIDEYDAMWDKQKQIIGSSFDLFNGFTADTSVTFDTLMKNLQDTKFYMDDWATAIEQLGQKNVSKDLLDQLKGMGADGWKYIYALNHASETELKKYSDLWEQTYNQIDTTTNRLMTEPKNEAEKAISDLMNIPDAKMEDIKAAFGAAGLTSVKGYADGIKAHFDEAEEALDKLLGKQLEKLNSAETISEFEDMGKNLFLGLKNGMTDKSVLNELDSAVEVIVGRVVAKTKEGFKESSPSKVFDEIGVYLPEGLAGGVVRGTESAEKAIGYMTDSVISSARDELSGAELGIDLGVNAAALDRAASADSYNTADSRKDYSATAAASPTTFIFAIDSRELARATFADINDFIGQTVTLQAMGAAT